MRLDGLYNILRGNSTMEIQLDNRDNHLMMTFKKIIHDLNSPVAALKMLCERLKDLPDADKQLFNGATGRIERIVESFNKRAEEHENSIINFQAAIVQILREKEMEYVKANLQFVYNENSKVNNATIKGDIDAFQRMLSNLLNNAAEACCDNSGIISVDLNVTQYRIFLTIADNGRGIPSEVLQKLKTGVSITYGKENGHGIGFMQIRDTINSLNGTLHIESTVGAGSRFSMHFSRLQ